MVNFKKFFGGSDNEEYVEIDVNAAQPRENKVVVRPFVLKNMESMDEILNSLREGYTIAIIDIKPLKAKDIIELKRAVSKIKKTVDALEGSVAGFGDNIIIAAPQFAEIKRPTEKAKQKDRTDFIGSY